MSTESMNTGSRPARIRVGDVISHIERLAPLSYACDWDPTGFAIGDREDPLTSVVVSLDCDRRAVERALDMGAGLIVTHHPPIFTPLGTLTADTPAGADRLRLLRAGIAVYAAHTNLDATVPGVGDQLACCLGLRVQKTLVPLEGDGRPLPKLLTGEAGSGAVPGFGRICAEEEDLTRRDLILRVNQQLQTAGCIPNFDTDKAAGRIAVSGGSFDEAWIEQLLAEGVDTLVAGEIKHHVLVALRDLGIAAIVAGHEATERVILHPLASWIRKAFPALSLFVNEGLDYNQLIFRDS
ncbi:MAG: Nif3-like dinuclear metal center hexameric protein [Bacillota bacterium]|nr:Nif3-like dinuclear metal center hexameric protein [Bacillota bacterium]